MQPDRSERINRIFARLRADLSADKIDTVKDKVTFGTMQITYDAYWQMVPNLTVRERMMLSDILKYARKETMDSGSSEGKSAIIKQYKNRCKAYLISQGHDVNQDHTNWGEVQESKKAATSRAGA